MMKVQLHQKQKEVIQNQARFKIIRAGRRSGKTTLEIEDMSYDAVSKADRPIFYIAPTQKQARSIIWESMKNRLAGVGEPNESRLEMRLPTKDGGFSTIYVAGWENRENFRGMKAYKIVFDEVDTMKDFFIGWQEIFRPALIDLNGKATFIGTPKKENRNLRRLEKLAERETDAKVDWAKFHFKTSDNPHIPIQEIEIAKRELDHDTYMQEFEAEYIDNQGSLFSYDALVDMFTNTVKNSSNKYLIVDVADDGSDKTVISYWKGLCEIKRWEFARLNTESIIAKVREIAHEFQIPYSNIAVDAIGVGAAVASNSMLDGIIGYKSSYSAIKTDTNIVRLPNVGYTKDAPLVTDYKNLRSQCIFTLANLVNNHKIASKIDGKFKEEVIEELSLYQDASKGDGKRMATAKEDIKSVLGRSPDHSDVFIMRMYFVIRNKMLPEQSEEASRITRIQRDKMRTTEARQASNSSK